MFHQSTQRRTTSQHSSVLDKRPPLAPMSDDRFKDLLQGLRANFEEAEVGFEERRSEAIREILAAMHVYGITVEQLAPGGLQ